MSEREAQIGLHAGLTAGRLWSWDGTQFFRLQDIFPPRCTFLQRGKETGLEGCERKDRKARKKFEGSCGPNM